MMIDDNTLNQMVAMGIDEKLARRALAESNNNITLALECCFAANSRGGGAPDEQDAIARTGHPAFRKVRQRMYVEKQGSESRPTSCVQYPRGRVQPQCRLNPDTAHCADACHGLFSVVSQLSSPTWPSQSACATTC